MASWTLGNLTLKRPTGYTRNNAEVADTVDTLDGQSKKDVTKLKFTHRLEFSMLTITQVNDLVLEYERNEALDFSIEDGSFSLSSRKVIMTLSDIQYNKGSEFRANVVVTLLEV